MSISPCYILTGTHCLLRTYWETHSPFPQSPRGERTGRQPAGWGQTPFGLSLPLCLVGKTEVNRITGCEASTWEAPEILTSIGPPDRGCQLLPPTNILLSSDSGEVRTEHPDERISFYGKGHHGFRRCTGTWMQLGLFGSGNSAAASWLPRAQSDQKHRLPAPPY